MSEQANLMLAYKYRETYRFQAQQMPSKLEFAVERGPTTGEKTRHQLLGKVSPVERTARHQDTPYTPTPHDDRWSISRNFGSSGLIDDFDTLRTMVEDPNCPASSQVQALGLLARHLGMLNDKIDINDSLVMRRLYGVPLQSRFHSKAQLNRCRTSYGHAPHAARRAGRSVTLT